MAISSRSPARRAPLLLVLAMLVACRRVRPTGTNVLLISIDTVRQDVLSCYGHRPRHAPDVATSPALDQLAREGVRMLDAYGASSWTLPSHISLLTGQPPLVHGIETEVHTLDPATATMAEILHDQGYRTVGIYSAPYLEPHWGFGRGFDEYRPVYADALVAASRRATELRTEVEQAAAAADWKRYDDLKWKQTAVEQDLNRASEVAVTSDRVTTAVREQIESLARGGRPWFVFAHLFDAHCDYVPPPPYDTRFDPDYRGSVDGTACLAGPSISEPSPDRPGRSIRHVSDRDLAHILALYEGEVAWVDAHVGAILAALDASALAQKTLVIVVSDHGEEFFEHDGLGHRHALYEESVRVPMVLRLPGVLPAGTTIRGPVSVADVLPTVLDLLGLPARPTPGSSSFVPLIRGTAAADGREVLDRLVTMAEAGVDVDGTEHVAFRQVIVEDMFRKGPIKIVRSRSWPQFPTTVPARLKAILEPEAAAQYAREEVRWIDVDRYPAEPDDRQSTDFSAPAPRSALAAFRERYAALLPLRSARRKKSPLPENMRRNLESLGYVDAGAGANPAFPEPDVVLPPPPGG